MRALSMSQAEIAAELGTSKFNASIIEGQGKTNIERAKNTMKWSKYCRHLSGSTLNPIQLFTRFPESSAEANKKNIWMPKGALSVLAFIEKHVRDRLRERKVLEKMEIGITDKGDILMI